MPDGTAARPLHRSLGRTSASTVGNPRESKISLALIDLIFIDRYHIDLVITLKEVKSFLECRTASLIAMRLSVKRLLSCDKGQAWDRH